ncbi:MAG: hypothetical protein J5736_01150 [Bacilli bacterium]|nr:hypothetical protein [Bacilli bacterium]
MKKLEEKMRILGLDPKKEWGLLCLIDLLIVGAGIGVYLLYHLPFLLAAFGSLLPIASLVYLSRYDSLLEAKGERMNDQFVESFTYFSIYIGDGYNVYRALEETAAISKEEVKPAFEELLKQIDSDKTLRPYLAFAAKFPSLAVKEVMLSVYQMVDEGGMGYLSSFQRLFGSFSKERHAVQVERNRKKLGGLQILPLIGSAITMLTLLAALLSILGDSFDVA